MNEINPYRLSVETNEPLPSPPRPRSTLKWVTMGFVLAATIPFGFAVYGSVRESWAVASMPPGPRCGMGSFATVIMLGIGTPCFGCIGGAVGWIASKLHF